MSELRSAAGETLEFEVGPVERDEAPFEIASSNSAVVTTTEAHGYQVGNHVRIDGHVWNPINGVWVISNVGSTTEFTLSGVSTGLAGGQTGTVTRIAAVDLTITDTEMVFTAKRRLSDADAEAFLIKGNKSPLTGIALNSPSTLRKNMATVTIAASDTIGVLDSEDFYFDVQLTEPGTPTRVTRLDRGIWKIGAAVSRV